MLRIISPIGVSVDYLIIHHVKPLPPGLPKLDLERKKKSEGRSFLGSYASSSSSSSSSFAPSSDEERASDEENERAWQKGGEESDRRRPMAEEERKVPDGNNGELLLPWKAAVCDILSSCNEQIFSENLTG